MSHTIVVLISGEGTNLQALIDNQSITGRIIKVISNRAAAGGLKRAEKAGIPTTYHNLVKYRKQCPDDKEARERYDRDLAEIILESRPSLVSCAGWMHVFGSAFLTPLREGGIPVINLHPALPGQFNGKDAIHRAYQAYQNSEITKTGIMIHDVIEEVDEGQPLLVREIHMIPGESLEDLEQRIHKVEWVSLVEAVKFALQRLDEKRTNP